MNSELPIKGHIRAELRDAKGLLKELREVDNVFTTVGSQHVADQMASSSDEAVMSHMAIGTNTTTLTAGDTALGTQLDRNALTSFTQGTAGNANKVVYLGDWAAADGTGAITEAGIFNSSTAGTMLCATTFSVINKGASDTLQISCLFGTFYRKVGMKLCKFGETLFEKIPSQAEALLLRAGVETRDKATLWVERIVRTAGRLADIGRNVYTPQFGVATYLGL